MTSSEIVLAEVGRTIIHFQRLEHLLKRLSSIQALSSTDRPSVEALRKRLARTSRSTLGEVIASWVAVLNESEGVPISVDDSETPALLGRVRFDLDPRVLELHCTSLKTLLEERNALVHGGLIGFPWDSDADRREVVTYLNQLNNAIGEHLQFLAPIAEALDELNEGILVVEQGESPRHFRTYQVAECDA